MIFELDETCTWLREPLLVRMPDGSLCCEIFTGGPADGEPGSVVGVIRSDDNGDTWSDFEIIVAAGYKPYWASAMFADANAAYIFWYTLEDLRYHKRNHLLRTGADGRSFEKNEDILTGINGPRGFDIRHGVTLKNGRKLLPITWAEPLEERQPGKIADPDLERLFVNLGGAEAVFRRQFFGVMEVNDDLTQFHRYGKLSAVNPTGMTPYVPFHENAIAELEGSNLAMLIRGDTTNRLWRSDSADGGRTWSDPVVTDIMNPGSKPRIINLPGGRTVLLNNPSEKDYSDVEAGTHAYRTPLDMWVSRDGMRTWYLKTTLVQAPSLGQYPDGFYDPELEEIFLAWEDDKRIFFKRISLEELMGG